MMSLDKVWKDRNISVNTKRRLVEAIVFPVAMYGCESWTIKKNERRKIDAYYGVGEGCCE